MDLSNGQDISAGLAQQGEQTLMAELYPTPDGDVHRISAADLKHSTKIIGKDPSLTDQQRLYHLHHMLELSTLELQKELEAYQAAHRQLVEHEGDFEAMVAYPKPPADILQFWESKVDESMNADKVRMKESRNNTKAILKAMRFAEGQGE